MKILLVDDEGGFLKAMGDVLRDSGYEVLVAEDGKIAREQLETQHVDLIISDVFMPTLDGMRFHDYVRDFSNQRRTPFIYMSGYDDESTRALAADPDCDFFLSKTTPLDQILSFIESLRTDVPAARPTT
jgi:CheY-like chemotaxis protein